MAEVMSVPAVEETSELAELFDARFDETEEDDWDDDDEWDEDEDFDEEEEWEEDEWSDDEEE